MYSLDELTRQEDNFAISRAIELADPENAIHKRAIKAAVRDLDERGTWDLGPTEWSSRAIVLMQAGRYEDAKGCAQNALAVNPAARRMGKSLLIALINKLDQLIKEESK